MPIDQMTNESESPLANLEDLYQLSPMQQGMLFHSLYTPGSGVYFEQSLFTLRGDVDVATFAKAWQTLVTRHSILRSAFLWEDLEKPLQAVYRTVDLPLTQHDWRALSAAERELQLDALIAADRDRGFELGDAPLLRLALIRFTDDEYKFLLSRHHLLIDRWSRALLLKEFFNIYDALLQGQEPQLAAPRPYGDYIAWLVQQDQNTAEQFWRSSLAGFTEPTAFAVDQKAEQPLAVAPEYAHQRIRLSHAATENMEAFARRHRLTLNSLAQGAWALLLGRYGRVDDVVFGVTMAGRPAGLAGVESMVGLFVNTLPLRVQMPPGTSVLSWLRELQERQSNLLQYEYCSLLDIQGWSDVPRSEPLFESIFVFENLPVNSSFQNSGRGFEMESDRGIGSITDYPLTVLVTPGSELTVQIVYDCGRFEELTIERMLGHLATLLQSMVTNPDQRLEEVALITEAEREQLLVDWNQTAVAFERERCIHELFEAQVGRTPDACALISEGERLTYGELNQRANKLAHYLRRLGAGPEVLVGVFMERSVEMIVGLLGIIKAGGAYVPLDPTYPKERLRFTLDDARLSVVLTQERLAQDLPASEARVICLDRDWHEIATESAANPTSEATSRNLAYLIYTSGSTGKPKGVAIEHASVVAFLDWTQRAFSQPELDGVLASTSICFDLSVFEIFAPLIRGGKVILAEDALQLPVLVAKAEVKLINTVPSAAAELVRLGGLPANLETVNLAGEPLRTALVNQIYKQPGIKRVYDLYGPSEDTTYSTFTLRLADRPATIGRPISNTRVYVLDAALQPVPIGVAGELYIGGSGLVRGYFERPQLTAERFIPDPFGLAPGARLYRTGDLVRYGGDGNIEYLGRVDHQVKIRGYRIELGEIEAAINQHAQVRESVVLAREDEPGDKRLVAYLVPGLKESVIDGGQAEDLQSGQVAQWQAVWDETYREEAHAGEPDLNLTGWNSSYTGAPIPAFEMKEWIERTVERIMSLHPRRVLEIGCGFGLFLFRIAPQVERYHGVDLSQKALNFLKQQISSSGRYQNVTLSHQPADNFADLETCDTVILNSVVQYFPTADYLVRVLEGLAKLVKPGGSIFLGDLRSLRLLDVFHTSVQLYEARASLTLSEVRQRAMKEGGQEKELAVDPALFTILKRRIPQISRIETQLKRGGYRNELSKFRYDVILHIDNKSVPRVAGRWVRWPQEVGDITALRRLLIDKRPELIGITGPVNDRVVDEVRALELIDRENGPTTVGALRQALSEQQVVGRVDPEQLWSLAAELGYEAEVKWGAASRDSLDVVLRRPDTPLRELAPVDARREELRALEEDWTRYANNPLRGEIARSLMPELRRLLAEKLPEHMMPSAFVLLDALPLTANGKINRRALPPPGESRPDLESDYVAPQTPAEELLTSIWAEVLKLDQVGTQDNFFELGGHSLLATQVISRMRERFRLELPLRYLFEFPTVAQLAKATAEFEKQASVHALAPITKYAETEADDLLDRIDVLSDAEVDALLNENLAQSN